MALKSIQHAANAWGVSVHTVRRLATAGAINTVTVGRRRLVPESEILRIATTGISNPKTRGSKTRRSTPQPRPTRNKVEG